MTAGGAVASPICNATGVENDNEVSVPLDVGVAGVMVTVVMPSRGGCWSGRLLALSGDDADGDDNGSLDDADDGDIKGS